MGLTIFSICSLVILDFLLDQTVSDKKLDDGPGDSSWYLKTLLSPCGVSIGKRAAELDRASGVSMSSETQKEMRMRDVL